MEEKVIRSLNWYYYGVMVFTLIALAVMYYFFARTAYTPIDPQSRIGIVLQYVVIGMAIIFIPAGLYMIKFFKPQTLDRYKQLAAKRIVLVSSSMPTGIIVFYLLGGYRPMMWVAAIGAIGWYFTKPTLGKLEQEMKPEDPNQENY